MQALCSLPLQENIPNKLCISSPLLEYTPRQVLCSLLLQENIPGKLCVSYPLPEYIPGKHCVLLQLGGIIPAAEVHLVQALCSLLVQENIPSKLCVSYLLPEEYIPGKLCDPSPRSTSRASSVY